jgi:hypothetical protein
MAPFVPHITSLGQLREESQYDGLTVVEFYAPEQNTQFEIAKYDTLVRSLPEIHLFRVDLAMHPEIGRSTRIGANLPNYAFYRNEVFLGDVSTPKLQAIELMLFRFGYGVSLPPLVGI